MKVFKNKAFISRDYDCTNVVFCKSEKAPAGNWTECNADEIQKLGCAPLYKEAGAEYLGYL